MNFTGFDCMGVGKRKNGLVYFCMHVSDWHIGKGGDVVGIRIFVL
jgi:hypothetical protein